MKSGNPLPNSLPGAVVAQYRKRDGHTFGPYWFRVWRESGRYRKAYVRPVDLEEVRAACTRGAQGRREWARRRRAARAAMSDFTFIVRTLAKLERHNDMDGGTLTGDERGRLSSILGKGIGVRL